MGNKKRFSRLEQEILDAGFPIMTGDEEIVEPPTTEEEESTQE